MRPRKGTMKSLYCLCEQCNAKWFCARLPQGCPRCGSHDFLTTLARRPWTRAFEPSESTESVSETSANQETEQHARSIPPMEGALLASA